MDLITFPSRPAPISEPFEFTTVRPLSSVTGILSAPNGSVRFHQGATCIIAAAFGPTDVRISKELPHRGVVDVLYRPKVTGSSILSQTGTEPTLLERALESTLAQMFETTVHLEDGGRTGFNIVLHELECDGDLLSSCVNAATLALLDGGCPLRHTLAAVTLILAGDQVIIDPNLAQMKKGFSSKMTYVFSNNMSLIYCDIVGRIEPKVAKISMDLARTSVKEIFSYYHSVAQTRFMGAQTVKDEAMFDESIVKEEVSSDSEGEVHSD